MSQLAPLSQLPLSEADPFAVFGVVFAELERRNSGAAHDAGSLPSSDEAYQALQQRVARLSQRERTCLHLIAEGKSDVEIARQLGLALPTVATHVTTARAKLQARSRAQAIARYMFVCFL